MKKVIRILKNREKDARRVHTVEYQIKNFVNRLVEVYNIISKKESEKHLTEDLSHRIEVMRKLAETDIEGEWSDEVFDLIDEGFHPIRHIDLHYIARSGFIKQETVTDIYKDAERVRNICIQHYESIIKNKIVALDKNLDEVCESLESLGNKEPEYSILQEILKMRWSLSSFPEELRSDNWSDEIYYLIGHGLGDLYGIMHNLYFKEDERNINHELYDPLVSEIKELKSILRRYRKHYRA